MSIETNGSSEARSSGPRPHFIPDGWFALLDAFDFVGRELFPDDWTWTENKAPSESAIAASKAAERKGKKSPLLGSFANASEAEAARQRGSIAWDKLKRYLYSGAVQATIILDSGDQMDVQKHAWAARDAQEILRDGKTSVESAEHGQRFINDGWVLVSKHDLTLAVQGARAPARAPAYLPPYLKFMVRAVGDIGLSAGKRNTKAQIENWLRENWPRELGKSSESKIEYMATFLRHPEDQKGGHFRGDRKT